MEICGCEESLELKKKVKDCKLFLKACALLYPAILHTKGYKELTSTKEKSV